MSGKWGKKVGQKIRKTKTKTKKIKRIQWRDVNRPMSIREKVGFGRYANSSNRPVHLEWKTLDIEEVGCGALMKCRSKCSEKVCGCLLMKHVL